MRYPFLLAALAAVSPLSAQNWFIPDNSSTVGTCNVIPFGSTVGSGFYQCKYQTRCTAADLGNAVNIITGLGFASCSTGRAHYDTMEIVIDHIPAAQPLVNTFAANLTPAAVTVLSATNYTWHVTADVWNEIGLQNLFVYNGVDDIVVQITMSNGITPPGLQGFRRGTRQRLYWIASSGTPAPTGTFGNAAGKIEVSMLMARTSSHGDGCLGTNGTPLLGYSGSSQQGNVISFNLTSGVPFSLGLFIAGTTNGIPFPLDLGFLGAPGCYLHTDLAVTAPIFLDGAGAGSLPVAVPPGLVGYRFFGQYAVLDLPANPFGFTTSNYLNVLTGN